MVTSQAQRRANENYRKTVEFISVVVPPGTKQAIYDTGEESISEYVRNLILDDLEKRNNFHGISRNSWLIPARVRRSKHDDEED